MKGKARNRPILSVFEEQGGGQRDLAMVTLGRPGRAPGQVRPFGP